MENNITQRIIILNLGSPRDTGKYLFHLNKYDKDIHNCMQDISHCLRISKVLSDANNLEENLKSLKRFIKGKLDPQHNMYTQLINFHYSDKPWYYVPISSIYTVTDLADYIFRLDTLKYTELYTLKS